MKVRALSILVIFLLSSLAPIFSSSSAESAVNVDGIEVLHTEINPANNHTYHLLSASSWNEAAEAARGLDGFLTTINDADENLWVFDTFSMFDNQSRHLWIGLSDYEVDGEYSWHNGAPFYYNDWGDSQPSQGGDENYVHIAGTNMGNIMPGTWNDLENDPQYFPVYGVVEVGEGADFSLRFNGDGDHVHVPNNDSISVNNSLHISAWIYPTSTDDIQFITMKGDYGWGLYLNDGNLSYSSEYSLSKHPSSNHSVLANEWTHVEVRLVENLGGEFTINGIPAGAILPEEAMIPQGDFGSNDCFTSGQSCDELYIGSMGAGCECNYFVGLLDNISIGTNFTALNQSTEWVSNWTFAEGKGAFTLDSNGLEGSIDGADWVMPDGTIVAQAIELFNSDEHFIESVQPGDTLLFYADIDSMTQEMFFNMFSFGQFGKEEVTTNVYISHEVIPNSWEHDFHYEAEYTFISESWSWPEEGTWWFVVIPEGELEDISLTLTWEIADPPPALDDMTELIPSIPVTGQTIDAGRQADFDERVLYYYMNVTEPLASLTVETYGGTGNVELGLSWGTVPDPFDQFNFDDFFGEDDDKVTSSLVSWDTGQGNEHEVALYDVEPGMYYITAYTWGRTFDFTIMGSFAYAPENIEPEDAVELTPGVPYGPLSGYDGLLQYFKINVPTDTGRLVVDLNDGFGEATLYMGYLEAPDTANYDHLSGAPGAGDSIGFNEPTPGMWYILVETEEVFANVMITASFAEPYVWSYDGTPIQLFNDEALSGIEAPQGEELYFFIELEQPAEYLEVVTFGGEGDLLIQAVGDQVQMEFNQGPGGPNGRQGGNPDVAFTSEPVEVSSKGDGTSHSLFVQMPANGRFDITLVAEKAFTDVSIIATWVASDIPPLDDDEPDEPTAVEACTEIALEYFTDADLDEDGVISIEEFEMSNDIETSFDLLDLNGDGELESREIIQEACSCSNELQTTFNQLENSNSVSVETLSSQVYLNSYSFLEIDTSNDGSVSSAELERAMSSCVTVYDAFDGDRDGVPDDEDDFPNDPDESKDTDGDGVGDNADIAPTLANDVLYSSGAGLLIILLGALVFFLRGSGGKGGTGGEDWEDEKHTQMSEQMLEMAEKVVPEFQTEAAPNPSEQASNPFDAYAPTEQSGVQASPQFAEINDLLESSSPQPPSSELMGMIDSFGSEVLEYPPGSGERWTRSDITQPWLRS